jgi:hypothetical protein
MDFLPSELVCVALIVSILPGFPAGDRAGCHGGKILDWRHIYCGWLAFSLLANLIERRTSTSSSLAGRERHRMDPVASP